MAESDDVVRCPQCARLVPVPEDWRVVVCPTCGAVITRMASDSEYD